MADKFKNLTPPQNTEFLLLKGGGIDTYVISSNTSFYNKSKCYLLYEPLIYRIQT